jgi:hypothetical protein
LKKHEKNETTSSVKKRRKGLKLTTGGRGMRLYLLRLLLLLAPSRGERCSSIIIAADGGLNDKPPRSRPHDEL